MGAVGAHGGQQRTGTGIEPDPLGIGSFQSVQRQPLEHSDPLLQGRFEFQLAAHGALGDGGDLGFQAGHVGQLVQAFDIDDGGIHVGHQQLFAARFRSDQIDVQLEALGAVAYLRREVLSNRQIESESRRKDFRRFRAEVREQSGVRALADDI